IMQFEMPVLETERLILRNWREEDKEAIAAISTDEEAARFVGGVAEGWQAFRMVAQYIGHLHLRGFTMFAVEEKETGQCLGWAGPWKPDGWPGNEIGYGLRRSAWGKGYAAEAAIASLRFAYSQLGWESAISCIDKDNIGSQGVAKKLGAVLEQRDVPINNFVADVWRHLPPADFMERFT
ncbi:MAG: GNAT family N-acetyltransferase, partial [Pseudomonadota bacterium]